MTQGDGGEDGNYCVRWGLTFGLYGVILERYRDTEKTRVRDLESEGLSK